MNPEIIKHLRISLGRQHVSMARIVGVSALTWGRWERGETTPLPIFQEKLEKLYKHVGPIKETEE